MPNISWMTTIAGALSRDCGYATIDSTDLPPCFTETHSRRRGDLSTALSRPILRTKRGYSQAQRRHAACASFQKPSSRNCLHTRYTPLMLVLGKVHLVKTVIPANFLGQDFPTGCIAGTREKVGPGSEVPRSIQERTPRLDSGYLAAQHFLYFLPLPQGQGSLRPAFVVAGRNLGAGFRCRIPASPAAHGCAGRNASIRRRGS